MQSNQSWQASPALAPAPSNGCEPALDGSVGHLFLKVRLSCWLLLVCGALLSLSLCF